MSRWIDQFQSHPIQQHRQALKSSIEALEPNADASLEIVNEITRLKKAFIIVSAALSNADPELLTVGLLDELNGPIQNTHNVLVAYSQNTHLPHLQQANSYLDQLLSIIPRLPTSSQDSKGKSLADLLVQYSKTIDKHVGALEARINEDNATIKEQKRLIDAATKKLNEIENRANAVIEHHQIEYNKSDQARAVDFQAKLEKLQIQIDAHATTSSAKIDASTQALEAKVTQKIADLELVYDESMSALEAKNLAASRLLESVGGKTQTHNYAGFSESEGKLAFWFRLAAIAMMITAVGILIIPPLLEALSTKQHINWEQLLYRIPTVLLVLIPAFYLAREASGHRTAQLESKRLEMELDALMPYMELFEDKDKVAFKKQLLASYFVGHGKDKNIDAASRDNWLKDALPTLVEKIIDRVMSDRAKG